MSAEWLHWYYLIYLLPAVVITLQLLSPAPTSSPRVVRDIAWGPSHVGETQVG